MAGISSCTTAITSVQLDQAQFASTTTAIGATIASGTPDQASPLTRRAASHTLAPEGMVVAAALATGAEEVSRARLLLSPHAPHTQEETPQQVGMGAGRGSAVSQRWPDPQPSTNNDTCNVQLATRSAK